MDVGKIRGGESLAIEVTIEASYVDIWSCVAEAERIEANVRQHRASGTVFWRGRALVCHLGLP